MVIKNQVLKPLTSTELKAIQFIESYYHRADGRFPSKVIVESNIVDFDINDALDNATFRLSLTNRGINPPVGPLTNSIADDPDISPEQLAAILTIINFEDKRTRGTKLRELGLTPSQWQGWLKQDSFRETLIQLSGANFKNAQYIANEALVKAMDRGDVNAIKFYSELTGNYKPATQQVHNIKIILARVVEAIQRHVRDPDTLRRIGEDFELILNDEIGPSRQLEKPVQQQPVEAEVVKNTTEELSIEDIERMVDEI